MHVNETAANIKSPLEMTVAVTLSLLLMMPSAFAGQRPVEIAAGSDTPNPAVATTQETPVKALETHISPQTSGDFLMNNSPVAVNIIAPKTAGAQTVPHTPAPAPLPFQAAKASAEEIAMLVSEQCHHSGDEAEGCVSCSRVYSNGNHATVTSQRSNEGDEFKEQAVVEDYDKDNTPVSKKTTRHRVDYGYFQGQKVKEQEFFDIIVEAKGKKTTRELMVYQYYLNTGKPKNLSWAQYRQIGHEPKAALTYYASLRYGADGNPERGIAERWNRGQKAATYLDWSRFDNGSPRPYQQTWAQWEGWIQSVSLQAYLP